MHARIDYTNWRGERSTRLVRPTQLNWGSTEYHPEPQWLLEAQDVHKDEPRHFALKDIHAWDGDISLLTKPPRPYEAMSVEELLAEVRQIHAVLMSKLDAEVTNSQGRKS